MTAWPEINRSGMQARLFFAGVAEDEGGGCVGEWRRRGDGAEHLRLAAVGGCRYVAGMSTLTQTLFTEIESASEPVQREVLDFVVFLKSRGSAAAEGTESLLPLAGRAWDANWNTPEEDAAWRDL